MHCVGQEKIEKLLPGKMGNKGGVAIRFELYQTSICFVNSHFAAHLPEYKKRNRNFHDISKKMIFKEIQPNKRIMDHDMIFWLGKSNLESMNTKVKTVWLSSGACTSVRHKLCPSANISNNDSTIWQC